RVAIEAASARPRQARFQKAVDGAEALDYLQAAARNADRAAAVADGIVRFDQHARHAVIRETERGSQPDRAAADDGHRMALRVHALLQLRHARCVVLRCERVRFELPVHPMLLNRYLQAARARGASCVFIGLSIGSSVTTTTPITSSTAEYSSPDEKLCVAS